MGSEKKGKEQMTKEAIDDVIADGVWRIPDVMRKLRKGKRKTVYIAIGRPRPDIDPKGDWICPIQIECFTSGVKNVHGVGALDALMNALSLLRQFFDINTLVHLEPTKKSKHRAVKSPGLK
jgi:hypothetical protein